MLATLIRIGLQIYPELLEMHRDFPVLFHETDRTEAQRIWRQKSQSSWLAVGTPLRTGRCSPPGGHQARGQAPPQWRLPHPSKPPAPRALRINNNKTLFLLHHPGGVLVALEAPRQGKRGQPRGVMERRRRRRRRTARRNGVAARTRLDRFSRTGPLAR